MQRRIKNPFGLKVRRYATHMIDLNEHLFVLPGTETKGQNCVTEQKESFLDSIPFDCGFITFKIL